jgi:hypothetical protein
MNMVMNTPVTKAGKFSRKTISLKFYTRCLH